jgi:hypothetical protein
VLAGAATDSGGRTPHRGHLAHLARELGRIHQVTLANPAGRVQHITRVTPEQAALPFWSTLMLEFDAP